MRRCFQSFFVVQLFVVLSLVGCGGGDSAFVERYVAAQEAIAAAAEHSPIAALASPADAVSPGRLLPLGSHLGADDAEGAATAPAEDGRPVHWSKRRGPAYRGDFWHSFGRDAKELPATIWDDTKATFTNPWALAGLGVAGAAGIAINASGADDSVADHFTKNRPQLSKFGDMVGDVGGNPGLHFGVAGVMYFASLAADDTKTYETSKALINALAINGLTTLALKGLVRTGSPNGDSFGWPSGHTSSTFCLATVMHEAYGPLVGVPLFAFASFVGYERIDARNHDFSDVISGALIGIAIGHAVMQNHKPRILGFEVVPWADPETNAVGLMLVKEF